MSISIKSIFFITLLTIFCSVANGQNAADGFNLRKVVFIRNGYRGVIKIDETKDTSLDWILKYQHTHTPVRLIGREKDVLYVQSEGPGRSLNVYKVDLKNGRVIENDNLYADKIDRRIAMDKEDGQTIGSVSSNIGLFKHVGQDKWTYEKDGKTYNMKVTFRDQWSVDLEEEFFNLKVILDMFSRQIRFTKVEEGLTEYPFISTTFNEIPFGPFCSSC